MLQPGPASSTASSASGTVRDRASTVRPTRSSTRTTWAPRRRAACWPSAATTRPRKSSSIAHQSEYALIHCGVPGPQPGQRAGVPRPRALRLGAVALCSGCWVGSSASPTRSIVASLRRRRTAIACRSCRPTTSQFPAQDHHVTFNNVPSTDRTPAVPGQAARRPGLRARERARPHRARFAGRDARIGIVTAGKASLDVRQALEEIGIDEARAAALGISPLQGRDDLAPRAGRSPRLLPRPRGRDRHRGEAPGPRGPARPHPVQRAGAAPPRGQARSRGRPPRPVRRRAGSDAHRGAPPRVARREAGSGSRAASARVTAPGRAARAAPAAAVVLFRMPAQHLHRRPRRLHRARGHRVSRHGGLAARPQHLRRDPHGRRRRQLDRPGAVHFAAPHLPEPRRWHLLPLRAARHPGLCRGQDQHHLQDPRQRRRRDDRRPTDRRRADGRGDHLPRDRAATGRRGRGARRRRIERAGQVRARDLPEGRHRAPSRRNRDAPEAAPGDGRRHRTRLRPDLRRGGPAPSQARRVPRSGSPHRHQRGRLRGLRRLLGPEQLHLHRTHRDGVRPQAHVSTNPRATRTTRA